mgnify:CR=1 FL=1
MVVRLVAILTTIALPVWAQLPEIQLDALAPAGAQQGQTVKVQLHGEHLTELSHVHCDHEGIKGSVEDGQVALSVDEKVPPGVYDVRVQGRFGLSNPRAFVVGTLPEQIETGDHNVIEKAMSLPLDSVVHGQADGQTIDWYRLESAADSTVFISVLAERIDSHMDPTVIICDVTGHELQREQDGAGRDVDFNVSVKAAQPLFIGLHDQLYEGGSSHFYRLEVSQVGTTKPTPVVSAQSLASVALQEVIDLPIAELHTVITSLPSRLVGECEVGQAESFDLQLDEATPMAVEVYSDRFGKPSDYRLTISRVDIADDGKETLHQVTANDDQSNSSRRKAYRTGTRDPMARFQAAAGKRYRVVVRNQFRGGPGFQLVFRQASPNYYLIAASEAPAEKGNALSRRSTTLRAGGVAHWPILLMRRDGFDGEVKVTAHELPEGVHAVPITIAKGQSEAMLVITAKADVSSWVGKVAIQGDAVLQGEKTTRQAYGATVLWSVGDSNNQRYESRITSNVTLAVVSQDKEPVVCAPEQRTYETSLGGKLEIPLKVTRLGEQKGPFKIVPAIAGLRKPTEVTLDNKANEVKLTLNVVNNDGNKFSPGDYVMVGRAREGKVSYRVNPQAAERAEAEKVRLEEELKTVTAELQGKESEESKKRLEGLTKAKDQAVKRAEEATKQAAAKDLEHSFLTHPVTVRIVKAPFRFADLPAIKLHSDQPHELQVSIERLFEFKEAVTLELQPPKGVSGLEKLTATIAKDAKDATLTWALKGKQKAGDYKTALIASATFNGQKVSTTVPITVHVQASSPKL